jgi:Domain of unknown function (DUF4271)
MKLAFLFSFLFFLFPVFAVAQSDTASVKPDSLTVIPLNSVTDSVVFKDTLVVSGDSVVKKDTLRNIPPDTLFIRKAGNPTVITDTKSGVHKTFTSKDNIFYYLIFLFLLLGLLHRAFEKYFNNLFRVFFRSTLNQRSVRDQLLQSPLPSVLLNCFFVLSAGLYVLFILLHFRLLTAENFWQNYVYCVAAISFVYIIKFIGLKITGWLFNISELTESYIFIVFIINKMLGITLLPFTVLLAFTSGAVLITSLNLSWISVALLFGYRFILSYGATRKEIKLNPFHFILYICAFEIVPLLLIYKLLLIIF